MKKILAVLMSIIAVLVLASPAQADTDTWRWKRHHRVAAVIRTVIWEESVYDLGICEDVNGPPTDPEVYCTVLNVQNLRDSGFKGRCVIRVQVGTFGVGGNPDQTVTDTAYPISLDLEPQGEYSPTVVASYSYPPVAEGQYPDDWRSDYWVQSCTYKGVTLH